jgi:uncharacterized cupredoxin-like copper-binding protein
MRKLVLLGAAAAVTVAVAVSVPLALASTSGATVTVSEKEFKMSPSVTSVKAGTVTFKIKNKGALDHTFVIVKTSLPASKLPLKNDRVTLKPLKDVGPFKPGKGGTLTLTLKPGKFVLYCNIKAHYKAGQRIAFTVK